MYNIKDVIERLKIITQSNSNIHLAQKLNISYNTLNTWIKRGKIPQEILIEICKKYNSSLDYILFNKNTTITKTSLINTNNNYFIYYGYNKELNVLNGAKLYLDKYNLHSDAFFLLNIDNLYTIKQVEIDIFNKKVIIKNSININEQLTIEEFKKINLGMIISIENNYS